LAQPIHSLLDLAALDQPQGQAAALQEAIQRHLDSLPWVVLGADRLHPAAQQRQDPADLAEAVQGLLLVEAREDRGHLVRALRAEQEQLHPRMVEAAAAGLVQREPLNPGQLLVRAAQQQRVQSLGRQFCTLAAEEEPPHQEAPTLAGPVEEAEAERAEMLGLPGLLAP
jgi:hypothetical protein